MWSWAIACRNHCHYCKVFLCVCLVVCTGGLENGRRVLDEIIFIPLVGRDDGTSILWLDSVDCWIKFREKNSKNLILIQYLVTGNRLVFKKTQKCKLWNHIIRILWFWLSLLVIWFLKNLKKSPHQYTYSHVSFVSEILRMNFPRFFLHSSSITYHHHMECIL